MEETSVAQTEPLDFPDPKMNEIKKAINRGRWTKEEVRSRLFKIIKRFSFNIYLILTNL